MMEQHTGRNTLDTATASQTTDSGLRDTLDVVTKNLAVTLGAALSKTLAALAAYDKIFMLVTIDANKRSYHDEIHLIAA